ncbi:MAG: histidine kinase [Desulfovibrio sp. MES5]|uniref:methyl-accepting chemotaxis protein n=1 Tax=Desulfovibrio sp. MES5 TaxID=1899016 RepID=UPI000B9D09F9|nr:methyl-accepting chemotaxis protein [Desulfovibrio sp. MES5]OXS29361.1 MAG: histidine kinase [Desulfovibrio sp. MES5]
MFAWYQSLRMTPKIVIPVALALVVCLGLLTWQIQARSSVAIEAVARRELAALGAAEGNSMARFLNMAVDEASALAGALGQSVAQNEAPTRQGVIAMISGMLLGNADFFGVGIIWEPNAFDNRDMLYAGAPGSDAKGRFMPYLSRGAELVELGEQVDQPYYAIPRQTRQTYVSDPIPFKVNGEDVLMSTVACPILHDKDLLGAVLVDISLARLQQIVSAISLYGSGYASLVSEKGDILAHHDASLIGKNIFDLGVVRQKEAAAKAFAAGKAYTEDVSGAQGVLLHYFYPVDFRGGKQHWYLAVTVPQHEVLAQARDISRITVIISAITLLVLLGISYLVIRGALRPVNYLAETAGVIAGGKLDQNIDDSGFGGEMKELAAALKKMIAALLDGISRAETLTEAAREESEKAHHAMLEAEDARKAAESARRDGMLAAAEQLEAVVSVVSSASTELSAQIEQSDRSAAESSQRLAEAATAMNQMNATVQEVARNASQASEASTETKRRALAGASIVEQSLQSIRQVREVSETLRRDMALLNTHAQDINRIMSVISDIADQTNLLALNAAIEAARAGDAGRGFAVVADEVRKLAEKTMASTTDVGNAIRAIQESTTKSMASVDEAVRQVEQATNYAGQSGQALGEIVGTVESTADQVNAIATASEEQSAASEQINQTIVHINTVSRQTAEAMAEASKAVADLAAQAQALDALVDTLKRG